jgi:hypothetical protein
MDKGGTHFKQTYISKTMTIKKAAAVWNNPRADYLDKWAQMFSVRLEEITPDHIITDARRGHSSYGSQSNATSSHRRRLRQSQGMNARLH